MYVWLILINNSNCVYLVTENVNRPKDFNLAKKNEMMMDRKVSDEDFIL